MDKVKINLGILMATVLLGACGIESTRNQSATEMGSSKAAVSQSSESKLNEESTSSKMEELAVHYIDAGQADATLFEFEEGEEEHTILYDTGDWNSTDVVDYLSEEGIEKLDLVIVSHPDADHIGQLDEIIQQFEVGEVWMSGNTTTSDVFARSLEAIQKHEIGYYEPRAGEQFDVGPLTIKILYPAELSGDTNADSISMLVSYGEIDFVFTGDAGKAQELEMVSSGMNVDAEILSLGHHGSDTSSAPDFVEAVSPEVAIYSAGENNSYGHPVAEVVSFIQQQGINLYGTDKNGTILVRTDGSEYVVQPSYQGEIIPGESESSGSKATTPKESTGKNKITQSAVTIDINTASYEKLLEIIHVGPERAEEIIALRPFENVADLSRVNGIGPAKLEDILTEGKACVGGE